MKRKLIMLLASICISFTLSSVLTGCGITTENNTEYSQTESVEEVTASITLGDEILVDGEGVTVDGSTVTITSPGTYDITGTLKDGQIIVENNTEQNVYLNLNGVKLTCSNSAPIYVKNSKNTIISLQEGTENIISDGSTYEFEDETSDEPNGAIFSKDDLTINGNGSLVVNANYNDGIVSKDDLKITAGNITVNSVGDAFRGKDSVTIKGGNITLDAGADGIKSTNVDDTTKGYVTIEGGTLNITAVQDGIQAETNVTIEDGEININTGGGSENASTKVEEDPGAGRGMAWGTWGTNSSADTGTEESTTSAKGIKATNDITVNGGTINIDSSDDSFHSNNSLTINNGVINIASGDDGIHSDSTLIINDGTIDITKSYEGIESADITINGGNIKLVASDDGINAAGGNDSSATNRVGAGMFSSSTGTLTINGGNIYVDATGDGLDANGTITMNDGVVIVNGPTNGGNGALDFDANCDINGGVLIAAGSSQMAETPSESSTENIVSINLTSQSAGTLVNISDANGENIITFAPSKSFENVVIASPNLTTGSTYTVSVGGSCSGESTEGLYEGGTYSDGTSIGSFTISSSISTVSQSGAALSGGMMQPGGGGAGGMGKPSGGKMR